MTSSDNPAEILLAGPGHYLAPLCGPEIHILVGEDVSVLRVETLHGQTLDIPIPTAALGTLARTTLDALKVVAGDRYVDEEDGA